MMWHLIDDVQLLDRQLVDLIQHIDTRDVSTVSFNHIDELIDGRVTAAEDVSAHDAVFLADRVHDLLCQDRLRDHRLEVNRTLLLASIKRTRLRVRGLKKESEVTSDLLEDDVRWLLVQSDTKAM